MLHIHLAIVDLRLIDLFLILQIAQNGCNRIYHISSLTVKFLNGKVTMRHCNLYHSQS